MCPDYDGHFQIVARTSYPAIRPRIGLERPHMSTVTNILPNTQAVSMVLMKLRMFTTG